MKNWKYFGKEIEDSIDEIKIVEELVYDLVKEIITCKSSGFREISSRCLKDALLVLTSQLSYIFKQAIKTGIFLAKWKIATIVPIFKGIIKKKYQITYQYHYYQLLEKY